MLEAVEQGQIESVYVYKLDRISRSLCDFAAMMQEFRRRGVTLHSVRESFDTQTEIGGMLLNLPEPSSSWHWAVCRLTVTRQSR